ncbi:MAG: hypothetical protein ACE5F1_09620 [Planctomycetota bacterium]
MRKGILELVELPSGGPDPLREHALRCDACGVLIRRVSGLVSGLKGLFASPALPARGNPLPDRFEELPDFARMLDRGEFGSVEDLCRERLSLVSADPSLLARIGDSRQLHPQGHQEGHHEGDLHPQGARERDSTARESRVGPSIEDRQDPLFRLRRLQKLAAVAAAAILGAVALLNDSVYDGSSPGLSGSAPRIVVVDSDQPLGLSLGIRPTKLGDPIAGTPLLGSTGLPGSSSSFRQLQQGDRKR